MRLKHLYNGDDGQSKFGELEIPWAADSRPDMLMTELIPVTGIRFAQTDPNRSHGYGSSPTVQFAFNLSGAARLGVGGGETWVFGPGGMLLVADNKSQGHSSTPLEGPRTMIIAPLAEGVDISRWRI